MKAQLDESASGRRQIVAIGERGSYPYRRVVDCTKSYVQMR